MADNSAKVVYLVGSTLDNADDFHDAGLKEALEGKITVAPAFLTDAASHRPPTPEDQSKLDGLNRKKVDLADEILVINVNGRVDEGMRRDIDYAVAAGKEVRFLTEPTYPYLKDSFGKWSYSPSNRSDPVNAPKTAHPAPPLKDGQNAPPLKPDRADEKAEKKSDKK